MSIRVVARIRPLLQKELDKDTIVRSDRAESGKPATIVKIPNPKNEAEEFSFAFNGVYDQDTTQETLFACEVQPHLKSLFQGFDVTMFAYGVTGTGKTHTMRGGLKLADRGVIPRLLSAIFRRGRKMTRDTAGATTVRVSLSYYEIYNDRVFDLLEPPDKRTPAGLPLRAEANGKTVVVGLSERACEDLRDFEKLYIEANANRVTAATKLNAHSSRSHAILRVKLTQTTAGAVLESTASAIDLAGSEDNRRTDNAKERLVESAAINKSLFVLGQCIDAISRGDKRVPYRESKMTRILSLGQNKGITVMMLNLAPVRSYHLDTLSSLNVSSRAKRIEVREIENEVVFKQVPRQGQSQSQSQGQNPGPAAAVARQPLRPLTNAHNVAMALAPSAARPVKAFSVYTDKAKSAARSAASLVQRPSTHKRPLEQRALEPEPAPRHAKAARAGADEQMTLSAADIEAMVEKKVGEMLAARTQLAPPPSPQAEVSEAVQKRLEALERRVQGQEWRGDARSDGLHHLLAARQSRQRGDDAATLRAYEMALPYFPGQAKLVHNIARLRSALDTTGGDDEARPKTAATTSMTTTTTKTTKTAAAAGERRRPKTAVVDHDDGDDDGDDDSDSDSDSVYEDDEKEKAAEQKKPRRRRRAKPKPPRPQPPTTMTTTTTTTTTTPPSADGDGDGDGEDKPTNRPPNAPPSPRTRQLLDVVNSRDTARIRGLAGFGAKRAQDLVDHLAVAAPDASTIQTLDQLRALPGMGWRTVERAHAGLA